jgi:peptidoglycan/xylan/chitin deacetylase (PgdA/CDA1 family)
MAIQLKRNDTKDTISYTMTYADGTPVNLTGATVRFVMGKGKTLITSATATIISAATGKVEYTLNESDTLLAGNYNAEFEVTFSDGKIKTFPSDGYISLRIQPNVDNDQSTYIEDQIAYRVSDIQILKNEIQAQLDQFAKGDSSAEVAQSRVESDGTVNTTLKARLDKKETKFTQDIQTLSSSLAQNANVFSTKKLNMPSKKQQRAMFTIIDDDGHIATLNRLKPLLDSKGIVACAAIVVDYMNNQPDYMKSAEVMQLKNAGWEIMSHSYNHIHLADQTESAIDFNLQNSYDTLNQLGFEVDGMVYPFGSTNPYILEKTKQIYKYAFGGLYDTNRGYLHTSKIYRVVIGDVDTRTLDYFKEFIDRAVKEKSWLVLNTHANTISDTQWQNLIGMIDYALTQPIEIVTASEAFEVFENQFELYNEYSNEYFIVGSNGQAFSNGIFRNYQVNKDNTGVTVTTPLKSFEKGQVTVNAFKNAEAAAGFPTAEGVLETYRHYDDGYSLSYQRWYPADGSAIYIRRWAISTSEWLPFNKFLSGLTIPKRESLSIADITVSANSNTSKTISPTKFTLGSSKTYVITPTSNTQGIVFTWSVNTSNAIVFRFNNLTANPITFSFAFNISEVLSEV